MKVYRSNGKLPSASPFAATFIRGVAEARWPELIKVGERLHRSIHKFVALENKEGPVDNYERRWSEAVEKLVHYMRELAHLECAVGAIEHAGLKPMTDGGGHAMTREQLRIALDESVRLQSHYAQLLNMHDHGARKTFTCVREWIERLRETGRL